MDNYKKGILIGFSSGIAIGICMLAIQIGSKMGGAISLIITIAAIIAYRYIEAKTWDQHRDDK